MPTSADMLGGRYRLEEPIAAGGMGEVWRATDTLLGRDVAVKLLRAARAGDPEFQTRFRREARTMAALHHPGVADVYDYDRAENGDGAYLVMAYVDGQPLDERIAEAGRIAAAPAMDVVAQAAAALDAAHAAGIVHRDVKPGNLIVRPDGAVVLVDFGVARTVDAATLTGVDEVVGTALYIAPEQVSKRPTGPAADVYALGAVAYHCLAGRPPFLGTNPVAVALQHLNDDPPPLPTDVPAPVRDLVAKAMHKHPAKRFTAAELAAAARALANDPAAGPVPQPAAMPMATAAPVSVPGRIVAAEPPTVLVDRPRRTLRRASAWALALAALTALALALALNGPDTPFPGPEHRPGPTHIHPPASQAPGGASGGGGSAGGDGTTAASAGGNPARPATRATTGATANPTRPATGPATSAPGGPTTGPAPSEPATGNQPALTSPSGAPPSGPRLTGAVRAG